MMFPVSLFAETLVYFAADSGAEGDGIYCAVLDEESGQLLDLRLANAVRNANFLVVDQAAKRVYAATRVPGVEGQGIGGVSGYRILQDGSLELINQRASVGKGPCHVSLDRTGKVLMVANYSDGSVGSYPIGEDGAIGLPVSVFRHEGSSVNASRQSTAHAHSINVDPSNGHAFAADLGTDEIRVYGLDVAAGSLASNTVFEVPAGGGVRHMTFHPSGRFAYANLELTSEVLALRLDASTGGLELAQVVSSLPGGKAVAGNSTAEILVHPSGRFVYVSNRGHDSVTVFSVDEETGELSYAGNESTRGSTPRNFGIDPSGRFLVAANQRSDDVFVFRINSESGLLSWTGSRVELPSPLCVRFFER